MSAEKPSRKAIILSLCSASVFVACVFSAKAQTSTRRLTLERTIALAQEQSISGMINENIYASEYWRYRSYRAGRLPSLHLQAGIANVNRSIESIPDPNTGALNYRPVFRLTNDLSLFVMQNIPATGGTLSLRSSLQRLDQFNPGNLTWYSQPVTLEYTQPLFGYNSMKWEKKIRPQDFEAAKLEYIENMESVTISAADYFWALALAGLGRDIAIGNHENSKRLYRIAEERYKIGAITRDQVLQMDLTRLRDSIAINRAQIEYASQRNRLASFIGLREEVEIELDVDYTLPDLVLDYDRVLATALGNSSFELNRRIQLLTADSEIARAKANRGIDISFQARFGMSQSGESFSRAYSHLRDQQVVGFSVGIPILDWGMGRGRVKMAQSQAETIRYQQEQARIDYEQDIFVRVMEFNAQRAQCEAARRAMEIATERFGLSVENFTRGTLSVTELNQAQSDKDNAQTSYLSSLRSYWNYYFNLRKISLYDFISRTDIGAAFSDAEFDKLIE